MIDSSKNKIAQKIEMSIWFYDQAEEAAKLYTSLFDNSEIIRTDYYNKFSAEASGMKEGSVLTVEFTLNGQRFVALNGGSVFKLTPALSLIINCKDQQEVDTYWDKLSEGGEKGQCGWLVDKFGLSWQVIPTVLNDLLQDPDPQKAERAMVAMLQMTKIDIDTLLKAAGEPS